MALETILRHKKTELLMRTTARPLSNFRASLGPSRRSLEDSLSRPATGFTLECKRASPSRGQIRENFDPRDIASTYAPFADGISVLTDERFFDGDPEYLRTVSDASDTPVLCKDFILDPYQVYEARMYGADAILLMLSVLDEHTYNACADAAKRLDIDILTEVHDEAELERAIALDARIIGINNRNLKTLEVDLSTTERLAPKVPSDRVVVCESGISSHRDVVRLRDAVDAFLVGSALMERDDLDMAVRELLFGPVKVCGLTRPEDASAAFEAGATYGGLIFATESPRCIDLRGAQKVISAAPMRYVGVFVDAPRHEIAAAARELDLSAVQLHGNEDRTYIEALRDCLPENVEVWKALRVDDQAPDVTSTGADRVLLDNFEEGRRGGTGQTFDWSVLDDASATILSGGLAPENAARADSLGAEMLDVNSGVEREPGIKDPVKLHAFFEQLRGTDHE
ncbi:MAG: bifunctional indole-3-glycerol-phosphate synthase TrpC/phosphoribosylanthranilate isomerase TrpF [Myxococcota bacterium]